MRKINALCVYCGSSSGFNPVYQETATAFGRELAQRGIRLVYGGGKVGLMGAVADATLAAGGEVHGVIPRQLMEKEVGHTGLTSLEVVETMHQRKTRLYELSEAFVALPGGFGTMDEMFEMLTWAQLGLHRFPCAFVNVRGYYDLLRQAIDHMVDEGFLRSPQRDNLWYGSELPKLFDWLQNYESSQLPKWIDARTIKA